MNALDFDPNVTQFWKTIEQRNQNYLLMPQMILSTKIAAKLTKLFMFLT